MQKLNEWAAGKAYQVSQKLFDLLAKKTGKRYKVVSLPKPYSNAWGKFIGLYVLASDRETFRINFSIAKTEEIVSIDRFRMGGEFDKPYETLSLEGFGIAKVFNQIVDFLVGNHTLASQFKESVNLQEGVYTDLIKGFLRANEQWVDDFKDGNYDSKKLKMEVDKYCADNGYTKYTNLSYIVQAVQNVLSKDPAVAGNAIKGKAAAAGLAVTKVVKGQEEKPLAIEIDPATTGKFQSFWEEFQKPDSQNPKVIIDSYVQAIKWMVDRPNLAKAAIVAFGKPGTGKTYHAQNTLSNMGMSEGIHYVTVNSKVANGTEGLIGLLNKYKDMMVIVFDDCDNIFRSKDMANVFKNALQDTGSRIVTVASPVIVPGLGTISEDFEITAKFVFCTNLQPAQIDSAFVSRAKFFAFNFTDEEILNMMKTTLEGMLPDIPELTIDKKLEVFEFLEEAVKRGVIRNLSYRILNEALRMKIMCEELGRDYGSEFAKEVKSLNALS